MSVVFRILGLAAAAAVGLWCLTIAIHSFTPQEGAGLPRLAGGVGLQALLGLAGLVSVALLVAASVSLTRPRGDRSARLAVTLIAWALAAAFVATIAGRVFLAPFDAEQMTAPGITSSVASAWATFFWVVAGAAGLVSALLLVRRVGVDEATAGARAASQRRA